MKYSAKVAAAVIGIYFIGGLLSIPYRLQGPQTVRLVAFTHLACIAIGLLGCVITFSEKRFGKYLQMLPLALAWITVGSTTGFSTLFVSWVYFPITVRFNNPNGEIFFAGVNLVPLILLYVAGICGVRKPKPTLAHDVQPGMIPK